MIREDIDNNPMSNMEALDILLNVTLGRLNLNKRGFSDGEKRFEELRDFLLRLATLRDVQFLFETREIKLFWNKELDNNNLQRDFLLSTHTQFITAIGYRKFQELLEDRAYALYYACKGSIMEVQNIPHQSQEEIRVLLEKNPWLATALLLGDITVNLLEEFHAE